MGIEEAKERVDFFKRLKLAIFKLEDYGYFLGERLSTAFKYFFLLIFIMTVIISAIETYNFSIQINKVYNYIENELPDFKYENGNLKCAEKVEAYDHDYKFYLFINTDENVLDENIEQYKQKIYDSEYGIIALKDKVIYLIGDNSAEVKYEDLVKEYNFNISNKSELVSKINSLSRGSLISIYFIASLIILYIINTLTTLSDICLIAIFGWVASRICGIGFKMAPVFALSIYSISLSIVLKCIYYVVLSLTGFVVQYFDIIYLLIAYVYMIAAIFMIKYDLMKQTEELKKIFEVQKKVHEELDKELNNDDTDDEFEDEVDDYFGDDDNDDDDDDENENDENPERENEPDGSEI